MKPGAFILAKNAQVPIQPVVLNHTKDALPQNSLVIKGRQAMEVKVLDEIPFSTFRDMEPQEIADMVREKVAVHVEIESNQNFQETA